MTDTRTEATPVAQTLVTGRIWSPFVVWLVDVVAYPFDVSYSTPPPVDFHELADYWRQMDHWDETHEDALAVVLEEAGLTECPAVVDGFARRVGSTYPCTSHDTYRCDGSCSRENWDHYHPGEPFPGGTAWGI